MTIPDLNKALKEVDKEAEDRAWAEKKKIYGDKFNAPKFYELSSFWPNFWAWFWIVLIWGPILGIVYWKTYQQLLLR